MPFECIPKLYVVSIRDINLKIFNKFSIICNQFFINKKRNKFSIIVMKFSVITYVINTPSILSSASLRWFYIKEKKVLVSFSCTKKCLIATIVFFFCKFIYSLSRDFHRFSSDFFIPLILSSSFRLFSLIY